MCHSGPVASDTSSTARTVWQGYDISLHSSIHEIEEAWDRAVGLRNTFLSTNYLAAVESAPPEGMQFYYVLVKREAVVGVIYLQLKHFNAARSLRYVRNGDGVEAHPGLGATIRNFVANHMDFYTLVCGNTLVTGQHGFLFTQDISQATQLGLVDFIIDWSKDQIALEGKNVQLVFIKDFFNPTFVAMRPPKACLQYNEFTAQPNMIMDVDPQWRTYQDYLDALQSKYRVRARRARKMRKGLVPRKMDLATLEASRDQLYDYYRRIADEASFNVFILHPDYIPALKRNLPNRFEVMGYYENGTLIAYFSIVENGDSLEAHFLGYDAEVNREHQLYLNMLLDMIEIAIRKGKKHIVFARTAMEIKSSVGAEPHEMYFYLQHNKGFQNLLLPWFYNLLNPEEEWVPRHPFRQEA